MHSCKPLGMGRKRSIDARRTQAPIYTSDIHKLVVLKGGAVSTDFEERERMHTQKNSRELRRTAGEPLVAAR